MREDSLIAIFNAIDSQIRHENDLTGQRTTWLVISQSFLFGSFVAVAGMLGGVSPTASMTKLLFVVVPLVGVVLPILVLLSLCAAIYAIWQWRAEYDRIREMPEAKQLGWPHLKHQTPVMVLGQGLPIATCVVFLLAWIVILIKMGTM